MSTLTTAKPFRPSDWINRGSAKLPSWLIYAGALAYALWLFYLGLTGGLGIEPIEVLEHRYGKVALQFIVLGLAVTPLKVYARINLQKHRRAIGVTAFGFVLAHLLVWALLDVQTLERVWADILKRPYVTIGMASFLLLVPLALTSNNLSLRKLGGASWRKLHKLTYPAAVLGALHYVWLAKGFQYEPLIYTGLIGLLLLLRIDRVQRAWRQMRA
ncbi:MAG: protein-methionine-sulfoxide reductase heme-binding subunit MsrQ [Pseudomonadota bacterium]